jgi:hypothetical protein
MLFDGRIIVLQVQSPPTVFRDKVDVTSVYGVGVDDLFCRRDENSPN